MLAELMISYDTNFEVAAEKSMSNWSPEPVMQDMN